MATYIAHIHIYDKPIVKTLHHTVNITSIEAKLFAIRCGINQAVNSQGTLKIIVITDLIHSAKIIFDSLSHPYQVHTAAILGSSSLSTPTTRLNSGNAQVNVLGGFIERSIRKLSHLTLSLTIHARCRGTLAKKENGMT